VVNPIAATETDGMGTALSPVVPDALEPSEEVKE
jgi:hypothetical protein